MADQDTRRLQWQQAELPGIPAHAASHQNGGSDKLNVGGLSGRLADPQTPLAHAPSHSDGGSDPLSVLDMDGYPGGTDTFLRGDKTFATPPSGLDHATTHQNGGADEINVAGLSGLLADSQTPLTHNITAHNGFPGGTATFLRADATFAAPPDTGITQLTGDVTAGPGSGSQSATIAADAVTNAKLADMPANTIKGNNTGGPANPLDLTTPEATAMLNVFTSLLKGLVPASGGGTTNFLRADGTFAAPSAAVTFTTIEQSLGSAPVARRSGHFTITGTGLSTNAFVLVRQAAGPYTDKGTRFDEAEMDQLNAAAKVRDATTIDVYWEAQHRVRGAYKFSYLVSA